MRGPRRSAGGWWSAGVASSAPTPRTPHLSLQTALMHIPLHACGTKQAPMPPLPRRVSPRSARAAPSLFASSLSPSIGSGAAGSASPSATVMGDPSPSMASLPPPAEEDRWRRAALREAGSAGATAAAPSSAAAGCLRRVSRVVGLQEREGAGLGSAAPSPCGLRGWLSSGRERRASVSLAGEFACA